MRDMSGWMGAIGVLVLAGCDSEARPAADVEDTSVGEDTAADVGEDTAEDVADTVDTVDTNMIDTADSTDSADSADTTPADTTDSGDALTPPPHGKLQRSLDIAGYERHYLVHVPPNIDGSRAVPVVFMLHGTSGTGLKFYNISGWVEKANREGFIAVFPTALVYCLNEDEDFDGESDPGERHVTTKWAAGKLSSERMPLCTDEEIAALPAERQAEIEARELQDDVAFFRAMVDELVAELPVDPKRMYVSGFSNGAQMSARLGLEMADVFAAFASAAGGPALSGTPARPTSYVFSVGSLDDGFLAGDPTTPDDDLAELPLDDSLLEVPRFADLANVLATGLSLDATQYSYALQSVNGADIATYTFDTSAVGADNQLIIAVIDGATHQYPNGTNHPVVMAELLWRFFERYALP